MEKGLGKVKSRTRPDPVGVNATGALGTRPVAARDCVLRGFKTGERPHV
jgi:hypothetical protein